MPGGLFRTTTAASDSATSSGLSCRGRRASGEVRAGVTTGDLLIVQRMIYGVVVTSQDADGRHAGRQRRRALTLLGLGMN